QHHTTPQAKDSGKGDRHACISGEFQTVSGLPALYTLIYAEHLKMCVNDTHTHTHKHSLSHTHTRTLVHSRTHTYTLATPTSTPPSTHPATNSALTQCELGLCSCGVGSSTCQPSYVESPQRSGRFIHPSTHTWKFLN